MGERESRAQEEVDHRVVDVRAGLEGRLDLKLKLMEVEAAGRTAALKSRLTEVE